MTDKTFDLQKTEYLKLINSIVPLEKTDSENFFFQ